MKHYRTLLFFLLILLFVALVHAQKFANDLFRLQRLSDKVLVLTENSPYENIIVAIASSKGLIIIDTSGSPFTAAKMRKVVEKEFDRNDFAYIINTHHHWDHTWGNQVFADVVIVGHEQCIDAMSRDSLNALQRVPRTSENIERMKATLDSLDSNSDEAKELQTRLSFQQRIYNGLSKGFIPTPPTMTFSDRLTLDLNDLTVRMLYFGRAHSGSDILIQVPEEGLLMTGDLFLERVWLPLFSGQPVLDVPRWIEALNTVLDGDSQVKYVIPGHRDIWDREKLVMWRDYIVNLWEGLVAAEAEGLEFEAVEARFPLDEKFAYLKDLNHSDDELQRFQASNIRAFWRQLKESAALIVEQTIAESGIDKALQKYAEIKSSKSGDYFFDEYDFNALGYRLLAQDKIKEAIEVFKLNVEAYPNSFNVWDSLGEAYMNNGETELAIQNYKKSLQLNPDNNNAKEILKRLEKTE